MPDKPVTFIGKDPRILEVLDLVEKVADTNATVLITGESGTGKELIAQILHQKNISRRSKPFISVNCGAISDTLQESELFGHTKGAFTGAAERKMGKFEAADGGTIFLDELSEMSNATQVKLLRVLQSGEYSPVGMPTNVYCDVRVVAATGQDLSELIQQRKFRNDLYYRLNVIRLELPPLRERRSDIPILIHHFVEGFARIYDKPQIRLSSNTQSILTNYDYPGNVRELENMVHRIVLLCNAPTITSKFLPCEIIHHESAPAVRPNRSFHEEKQTVVEEFEQRYLKSVLRESGGIVSRAANLSGLSERNFHEKLKKYGIEGKHYRAGSA